MVRPGARSSATITSPVPGTRKRAEPRKPAGREEGRQDLVGPDTGISKGDAPEPGTQEPEGTAEDVATVSARIGSRPAWVLVRPSTGHRPPPPGGVGPLPEVWCCSLAAGDRRPAVVRAARGRWANRSHLETAAGRSIITATSRVNEPGAGMRGTGSECEATGGA